MQTDSDCSGNSDRKTCYKQTGTFCTNNVGPDGSNCLPHQECHITTRDEVCKADYRIEVEGHYTPFDGQADISFDSNDMLKVKCDFYNRGSFTSEPVYCQPRNIIKDGFYNIKKGDTCPKIAAQMCGKGTKCNSPDDCPVICDASTVCQSENLVQGKSIKFDCNNSGLCNSKSSIQDCCGTMIVQEQGAIPKYLNPLEQSTNNDCGKIFPPVDGELNHQMVHPVEDTCCGTNKLKVYNVIGMHQKSTCTWAKDNNPGNVYFCKAPNPVMCSDTNVIDSSLCIGYDGIPVPDCSSTFVIDSTNPQDGSLCLGYVSTGNENYQCVWSNDASGCVKQDTSCNLPTERKYLGIAKNPNICKSVTPINGKCLAYYTQPEKKPRVYDGSYVDTFNFKQGDIGNSRYYSIAKPWYDSSLHSVHCVGDLPIATDFTIERCAGAADSCLGGGISGTKCSGFYFSPTTGDKGICGICKPDPDKIEEYGPATINIVDKATEGESQDKQYKFYSKTPEIWVSKDVSYAYEPYNCSDEISTWPTTTGVICKEDPIDGSCQSAIEDSINPGEQLWRQGFGCKTTILPPPKTTRTCLLRPTPAPIEPKNIFNPVDLEKGWNLIPYREAGNMSSWPPTACAKALPDDVNKGKYDFETKEDCITAQSNTDKIHSNVEIYNDNPANYQGCDRMLGQRCEGPKVIGKFGKCGDKTAGCPDARHTICAAGRGSTQVGSTQQFNDIQGPMQDGRTPPCDPGGGGDQPEGSRYTCGKPGDCNLPHLNGGVDGGISLMERAYCPGTTSANNKNGDCQKGHCTFSNPGITIQDVARDPEWACGVGMACYATGVGERNFNELKLCNPESEECRCLYKSAGGDGTGVKTSVGNNGSLSCIDFCKRENGEDSMCVGVIDNTTCNDKERPDCQKALCIDDDSTCQPGQQPHTATIQVDDGKGNYNRFPIDCYDFREGPSWPPKTSPINDYALGKVPDTDWGYGNICRRSCGWCGTCNHSASKLAIPGDSGIGANITCKCLGTTSWGKSWDISIANLGAQSYSQAAGGDPGNVCKRVVGHSCHKATPDDDSVLSTGVCTAGMCGGGLLCVDDTPQNLQGRPYVKCDPNTSKGCVCLPIKDSDYLGKRPTNTRTNTTLVGDINIMFPNSPIQQSGCEPDPNSSIPLLYQRCCKLLLLEVVNYMTLQNNYVVMELFMILVVIIHNVVVQKL